MPNRHDSEATEATRSSVLDGVALGPQVIALWPGGIATAGLPERGSLTIGRSKACDLRIDHASVSRRHVVLRVTPGGDAPSEVRIEDVGSSNGTRINGRQMGRASVAGLAVGDVVELGSAMLIVQRSGVARRAWVAPAPVAEAPSGGAVVFRSEAMKRLNRMVELVAGGRIGVLLLGETGVGKEVMAEAVHRRSPRAAGALVRINCAAVPDALLESELFGHERGAFTGAVQAKPGLFETAHDGTLFLDEVGELPLRTQAKLLRVLESGEVMRVGALEPRHVDVRIVAATNQSLDAMVAAGTFRRDLYYRLNGITLAIPPLRERREDLDALARMFLSAAAADRGGSPPVWTDDAMAALMNHPWPGNVRELKNVVGRACLLCGAGPIERAHLVLNAGPGGVAKTSGSSMNAGTGEVGTATAMGAALPPKLKSELKAIERQRIIDALERTGGNQTRAAELLGISRRTLVKRLDTYGVPRPRKRG